MLINTRTRLKNMNFKSELAFIYSLFFSDVKIWTQDNNIKLKILKDTFPKECKNKIYKYIKENRGKILSIITENEVDTLSYNK